MLRSCFLVAAVLGAAASCVSADEHADEPQVGLRGRDLVQGNNQRNCTSPTACQWGKLGSVDIKKFYVDHPNIFWRCNEPGMIALTYDDGPTAGTLLVLDELKKANVIGSFFINGNRIKNDETGVILTRAEQEGHIIAHHTFDHATVAGRFEADGKVNASTLAYFELEIDNNIRVANPYLPLKGLRPYFRPPYLDLDEEAATYLKDKYSIYVVQVNVDTIDYIRNNTKNITDAFTGNLYKNEKKNSWVALQHDEYPTTAAAIPAMVAYGKQQGYRFVGIDECLSFPDEVKHVRTFAPSATPCGGDPCPGDNQCRSRFNSCGSTIAHCMDEPMWIPRCRIETDMPCNLKTNTPSKNPTVSPLMCTGEKCEVETSCRSAEGFCGAGEVYCYDALWTSACNVVGGRSIVDGESVATSVSLATAVIGFGFAAVSALLV